MNIYINVEIPSRELDSKLLLGILAANKGHQVIVSDLESFLKGVTQRVLAPGIFHTKSLTPAEQKISLHNLLVKKGFKVTSNDEESAVEQDSFEWCAKNRFSEQTIDQAAAIFGWGEDGVTFLLPLSPERPFFRAFICEVFTNHGYDSTSIFCKCCDVVAEFAVVPIGIRRSSQKQQR